MRTTPEFRTGGVALMLATVITCFLGITLLVSLLSRHKSTSTDRDITHAKDAEEAEEVRPQHIEEFYPQRMQVVSFDPASEASETPMDNSSERFLPPFPGPGTDSKPVLIRWESDVDAGPIPDVTLEAETEPVNQQLPIVDPVDSNEAVEEFTETLPPLQFFAQDSGSQTATTESEASTGIVSSNQQTQQLQTQLFSTETTVEETQIDVTTEQRTVSSNGIDLPLVQPVVIPPANESSATSRNNPSFDSPDVGRAFVRTDTPVRSEQNARHELPGAVATAVRRTVADGPESLPPGSVYAPVTVNIDSSALTTQLRQVEERMQQALAAEVARREALERNQMRSARRQRKAESQKTQQPADNAQSEIAALEREIHQLNATIKELQTQTDVRLQQLTRQADRASVAGQVIESYRVALERLQEQHPTGTPRNDFKSSVVASAAATELSPSGGLKELTETQETATVARNNRSAAAEKTNDTLAEIKGGDPQSDVPVPFGRNQSTPALQAGSDSVKAPGDIGTAEPDEPEVSPFAIPAAPALLKEDSAQENDTESSTGISKEPSAVPPIPVVRHDGGQSANRALDISPGARINKERDQLIEFVVPARSQAEMQESAKPQTALQSFKLPDQHSNVGHQKPLVRSVSSEMKNVSPTPDDQKFPAAPSEKRVGFENVYRFSTEAMVLPPAEEKLLPTSRKPTSTKKDGQVCPVCGKVHEPNAAHARTQQVSATKRQSVDTQDSESKTRISTAARGTNRHVNRSRNAGQIDEPVSQPRQPDAPEEPSFMHRFSSTVKQLSEPLRR